MNWEAVALGVEVTGGFLSFAWFVVRALGKIDVRLARIETVLEIRNASRRSHGARVIRMGEAKAQDFGEL